MRHACPAYTDYLPQFFSDQRPLAIYRYPVGQILTAGMRDVKIKNPAAAGFFMLQILLLAATCGEQAGKSQAQKGNGAWNRHLTDLLEIADHHVVETEKVAA